MKVIMGVFLQITFYVASNDDVIMMSQKERPSKRLLPTVWSFESLSKPSKRLSKPLNIT